MVNHSKRAHALLSASGADRWLHCPPSAVASELYPSESGQSPYALEGTQAHEVAEVVARRHVLAEEKELPDYATKEMIEYAGGYADYIDEQRTEWNALILLEQRVDFSPWVEGGFGTADCIIIQGNTMDVIDYKYGKGVPVSAEGNPQEMLYGLGALNDYGFAYDIEKVRLHIYQPRINNISVDEFTAEELLEWGEHIVKPTAELAKDGKGDYAAGEWCKFCRHAGKCRTLESVCMQYVDHGGMSIGVSTLAPFEVAEVLRVEPLITLWLKRVKEQALSDMLSGESIPGYKVVAGKPGNRKWVNEVDAYAALIANGCSREEITETKLLSPAAMEKAFGKKRAAELLEIGQTDRTPGSPTIALESDKRKPYNPVNEFTNLEE